MALTRRQKWLLGLALAVLATLFVLPLALGPLLRGSVIKSLRERTNSPVELDRLSVSFLPLGARLDGLRLGTAFPAAGHPLVEISRIDLRLAWSALWTTEDHLFWLGIEGTAVHLTIDQTGQSNLVSFIKNIPPGKPVRSLWIEKANVSDTTVTLHVPAAQQAELRVPCTEALATISSFVLLNFHLPLCGLSGDAEWTGFSLAGVWARAPLAGSPSTEGLRLEALGLTAHWPPERTDPVELRNVWVEGLRFQEWAWVPGKSAPSHLDYARLYRLASLCFRSLPGPNRPQAPPQPRRPLLVREARIEKSAAEWVAVHPDGSSQSYRLLALEGDARDLAFWLPPEQKAPSCGALRLSSVSSANGTPGRVELTCENITGSYPRWSMDEKLTCENLGVPAFCPLFERGLASVELAGPMCEGQLRWRGQARLSPDTALAPALTGSLAANLLLPLLTQGKPIEPLGLDGTLEAPVLVLPSTWQGATQLASGLAGSLKDFLGGTPANSPNPAEPKSGLQGLLGIFGQ